MLHESLDVYSSFSYMEASVDTNSLSSLHLTPHSRRYGHIKDLLAYLVITTASLIPGLR